MRIVEIRHHLVKVACQCPPTFNQSAVGAFWGGQSSLYGRNILLFLMIFLRKKDSLNLRFAKYTAPKHGAKK